jgi:hypothetical protein
MSTSSLSDLLATSGDYLRVWRAGEPDTRLECVLNNNKNSTLELFSMASTFH